MTSSDVNNYCHLILRHLMFLYHSKCLPDISKQELGVTNVNPNAPFVDAASTVCTSDMSGKGVNVHLHERRTAEPVKQVWRASLTCKTESRICQ